MEKFVSPIWTNHSEAHGFSPGLCSSLTELELISTNSRIKYEYELVTNSAESCNFLMPPRRRLAAEKQQKIPKQRAIWRQVVGLHFYPSIALPFSFLFISIVAIAFLVILGEVWHHLD
jgi:hypothetical protein